MLCNVMYVCLYVCLYVCMYVSCHFPLAPQYFPQKHCFSSVFAKMMSKNTEFFQIFGKRMQEAQASKKAGTGNRAWDPCFATPGPRRLRLVERHQIAARSLGGGPPPCLGRLVSMRRMTCFACGTLRVRPNRTSRTDRTTRTCRTDERARTCRMAWTALRGLGQIKSSDCCRAWAPRTGRTDRTARTHQAHRTAWTARLDRMTLTAARTAWAAQMQRTDRAARLRRADSSDGSDGPGGSRGSDGSDVAVRSDARIGRIGLLGRIGQIGQLGRLGLIRRIDASDGSA